ncbi:3-phosphoshikimate 1-carboxyvinyltransferase [Clostridium tetanomorphum]|uniref:3-phosphoshikimate 1-carboxyvinyltransferase n=1 Tax=Clostridium tetanomorphum TaxID=1553 RepID=A0A923E8H1_CLOTT|nr:3-phosphoshikimate 1-carboxyvinyltransferase [Clostridium tetanomorphum]KAJ51007.1 3-phosphoshikimate 1-carboxyvinyltransferase [Clostridium tetanomorphum DSM 665]MBC2396374.1 3-phosphoshikimate 1-carboxyvinyltransferase [Clostridium tetanomorphum]MBP1863397.1 3-phosphoshikimate 1-carboxyvinyltransferase [Clostridium tetanomorphum]NRS83494.1 3-phosphoshikimate 1-carboxyvinyltransferase [Clostridium tetanomorphum]NRZ96694.1 3-phosphoshikimate 1-carboxyvinyltransferase [Clostridium tetanomorp
MNSVRIEPCKLKGKIKIPASKSLCHRAVICAALAQGESNIENVILSDDIHATCKGMESFGAKIENKSEQSLIIKGNFPLNLQKETIDCIESGSTLRFLIPIALLSNKKVVFKGRGKLVSRPLNTYYEIFQRENIKYINDNGNLPLQIEGTLKSGTFKVKGNISSQFITGLMFVLPLLQGDSKIIITTELESKGYVDLTIDMLNKFGIKIENNNYKEFLIKGDQRYINRNYKVEGDFSQAAFWLVAGILGEEIQGEDLNINSLQGDKVIIDLIEKMGGNILIDNDLVKTKASKTKGVIIDASQCPDLVPILTVLAALSEGETRIGNAERLRIKESDRLKAISTELNKLGADVQELEDGLIINGKQKLKGGIVDSWNDHRIAMALAIASIKCTETVTITNSNAVNKSYPHFWEDFKKLGGKLYECSMGK